MKKHFKLNWGWYGIGLFQLFLIIWKLVENPALNWFCILLPILFTATFINCLLIGYWIEMKYLKRKEE
jgi:hypothetical protein